MFYDSKMTKNVTRLRAFPAVLPALRQGTGAWVWLCCAALCAVQAAVIALPAAAQNPGSGNAASPAVGPGNGQGNGQGSGSALERHVKAAFLYKFLGYAEFPPGAFFDGGSPVTIGVIGADELAAELARAVAGRTIHNRPLVVRVLRDTDVQVPLHLLFVGGADPVRVGRLVRQAGAAMLVVTECEDGLRQGSVINFRIIDERVRFDVSLDAAERNGIKLSSRLLTVANRVQKGVQ
jgi:hypothetical protein